MSLKHEYVTFGSRCFEYTIQFADRKTLEIAVLPNCGIIVTAPNGSQHSDIEKRVRKRLRWINKQVEYFEKFLPKSTPRQFISGETHLYLGRHYRLKILSSENPSVKLSRGFICVESTNPKCAQTVAHQMDAWYHARATHKLRERFELCFEPFAKKGYEQPILMLRKMKTRWGSLSPNRVLLLNRDLIRAPLDCIDYVLVHELCHLKYADHGKAFYRLMGSVLPDWEKRKHRLEMAMV
jgi:predicted metal-dependent hydrolase